MDHRRGARGRGRFAAKPTRLDRTTDAIREADYEPDTCLWGRPAGTEIHAGDCMHSECTEGGSTCAAPPVA